MLVALSFAGGTSLLLPQAMPRGNLLARSAAIRMEEAAEAATVEATPEEPTAEAVAVEATTSPEEEQIKSCVAMASNAFVLGIVLLLMSGFTLPWQACGKWCYRTEQHGGLLKTQGDGEDFR